MKNIITFTILLFCSYDIMAQVTTTYFEGRDAFKSFPVLIYNK